MKKPEPKLCSTCPLTQEWKQVALNRIRERELIKNGEDPSALKVCMERRRILRELGLGACPHFPQAETMDFYTEEDLQQLNHFKEAMRKLKRQNIDHFL